jgi:hypothetical protein
MKDIVVEYIKFYFKDHELKNWKSPLGHKYIVMIDEEGKKRFMFHIESKIIYIAPKVIDDISTAMSISEKDVLMCIFKWLKQEYDISVEKAAIE